MYNILSLDGGGAWSVIQAACLADLYGKDTPGRTILSHFDLSVANSGGSLVLAGLCLNLSPAKIIELLSQLGNRKKIFKPIPITGQLGIGPRYQAEAKRNGLRELLTQSSGEDPEIHLSKIPKTINSSGKNHILICAFDYDMERAAFLRSNTLSASSSSNKENLIGIKATRDEQLGEDITLLDAIHSASHAPVLYFEKTADVELLMPDQSIQRRRYWDGAVGGNNNPALAGLTEALSNNKRPEDIRILSIGTGIVRRPVARDFPIQSVSHPHLFEENKESQFLANMFKMATSILSDPPDAASYIAYRMLHRSEDNPTCPKLVRMNPMISPEWDENTLLWDLPAGFQTRPTDFNKIVEVDMDAVSRDDFDSVTLAMNLWLEDLLPNQGIQHTRFLKTKIGQRLYSQAKAAWFS